MKKTGWGFSVRFLIVTVIVNICMNRYTCAYTSLRTDFGIQSLSSAMYLQCREVEPRLYNTVNSLVPPRSHLALKGSALHEYLSFLSQISRSEASCLQERKNRTKQRGRYAFNTEIILANCL